MGGIGKRVIKYTKVKPKCLIKFCGKPFLFYQLDYLRRNNVSNVILSAGYKSNQIRDYVKKNIDFINVKIIDDGNKLLGTGGAIKKSIRLLKDQFYVIYGDSFLNFKLKDLKIINKFSIMAIYKNLNKYDKSNVKRKKKDFILYKKFKKKQKFKYIDYGVSLLNKKIFKDFKINKKFDLSVIFERISKENKLKGFIVKKRFYEIGSYNGIKQFNNYIKNEIYKKI